MPCFWESFHEEGSSAFFNDSLSFEYGDMYMSLSPLTRPMKAKLKK